MKAAEQAECKFGTPNDCSFEWTSTALPTITSYTVNYDNSNGQNSITVNGNGFTGTIASTKFFLDGIE